MTNQLFSHRNDTIEQTPRVNMVKGAKSMMSNIKNEFDFPNMYYINIDKKPSESKTITVRCLTLNSIRIAARR